MSKGPSQTRRPPRKLRDPALVEHAEMTRRTSRDAYVGQIVQNAARSVYGRGQTSARVRIGRERDKKIADLRKWTGDDRQRVLNMAVCFAATIVRAGTEIAELRAKARSRGTTDSEFETVFKPNAEAASRMIKTGARDARHVLLNAGIDMLHERLRP